MTNPRFKYIRTEPPVQLKAPVTITIDGIALDRLNDYRQAAHAYSAGAGVGGEATALRLAYEDATKRLASTVAGMVAADVAEPSDWADA